MPHTSSVTPGPHVREQLGRLRLAVAQGAWAYAEDVAVELLRGSPGWVEVWTLRAQAAAQRDERGGARRLARLLAWPGPSVWRRLVRSPRRRWRLATWLVARDWSGATGWQLLAETALELGWPATAVFAWERHLEFAGPSCVALLGLSEALLLAERTGEALRVAEQALQRWPREAKVVAAVRRAAATQTLRAGGWEPATDAGPAE